MHCFNMLNTIMGRNYFCCRWPITLSWIRREISEMSGKVRTQVKSVHISSEGRCTLSLLSQNECPYEIPCTVVSFLSRILFKEINPTTRQPDNPSTRPRIARNKVPICTTLEKHYYPWTILHWWWWTTFLRRGMCGLVPPSSLIL